jgi:hypothetical protein
MIPLNAIPWRLVGYAVAGAAVLALGWRVSAWREAYKALPAAQEALQREIECGEGSHCLKRSLAAQAQAEAASAVILRGYEDEIEALRNRPPAPAVRLCRPARGSAVHLPQPAGPADGTAPGGDVPLEASGDIGQRLFALADACDAEALKLRYLQDWNRALAAD